MAGWKGRWAKQGGVGKIKQALLGNLGPQKGSN